MSEKKQYLIASSTNEWYTPPVYIDAVRAVLGSIQFDPFSCDVANTLVGADDYYTAADDATVTPWPVVRTVFANPPYERGLIDRCINTIITNHRVNGSATIVLVNVATDARWFQQALGSCNAVCFTAKRIRFVKSDGITLGGSNTRGQAFFYFGGDLEAFARVFKKFGSVLKSSL
jgi:hypothetical protein